tara:strand:+ start:3062 stop:3328 length:267 start_codon:yes stop_codon:yes gene_type:complete
MKPDWYDYEVKRLGKKYGSPEAGPENGFLLVQNDGAKYISFRSVIFFNWNDKEKVILFILDTGDRIHLAIDYEGGRKLLDSYLRWEAF